MVGNSSFHNMILHACLLYAAIKINTVEAACVDTEPFKFEGNENTFCAGQDCSKKRVVLNCPKTCGTCDDNSGGGSDSGSGGGGSGEGNTPCKNFKKKFKVPGRNGKKKCNGWKKLCGKEAKVDKKCPKTCNTCGPPTPPPTPPCEDVSGKFNFGNNGGKKNCKQIKRKREKLCKKKAAKENCPVTCGLCPTSSPSVSPTEPPSVSPTAAPSASPSEFPSAAPTKAECTLAGRIDIPRAGVLGYHSASLRVSKSNWNVICSSRKRKTGWGCVHEGEAKVGTWTDDSVGCLDSETATIEYAAGGTYNFTMEHVFDDFELYYDEDHLIRPELTITVNDVELNTIRYPKNLNEDTHIDGFVNGAYQGTVFGNVVCDAVCNCTVVRVMPECPIRAEIRFAELYSAPNLLGYQNDAISVVKDGEDDNCSKSNELTKWCVHEGDGQFYSSYGDDYYNDVSSTESIVVQEAANGNFLFKVEHDFTDGEESYYGDDYNVTGVVQLWVGHKNKGQYNHWFGGNYLSTFYLDVRCDDGCKCEIQRRETSVCKIDAKVKFPNKEKINYYGYKNEYMVVQKGGEIEKCQWENMNETSWGCLHDGGDAYVWYHNATSFEKGTENVIIDDGANGDFRFTLQHWPSNLDLLYSEGHKIYSTLSISINDGEPLKFSLPENVDNIDTHLEDGSLNPEYKGITHVDVSCDSACHCDIIEQAPTSCELNAVLSFPNFKENYYGYNADIVSVKKEGEDEECGYYSPLANWGCFSSGDAYIIDYADDNYNDLKSTQILNIADAYDSNFTFTVEYYNAEFDPDYYNSYKHKSELEITVGESQKVFMHNRNDEINSSDPNYASEIAVVVACDPACTCSMEIKIE